MKNAAYGIAISFIALSAIMFSTLKVEPASASASGFDPGNIMDDAVFSNSSSMSVQDIQNFLNSKVPVCDTYGTQRSEFGGGTRAQWAAARGYSPPFTCLKDFNENGKSSAQILYETGQEFKINPQVLIVLLQKEQALVTDTWPIPGSSQYRTATGYGCPDTAPCDSQYYGLTNQLRWSARMFRAILNNSPAWYTPYILGNNYIQWSPNSSCGGSQVNIQNRATQALYNYTPYRPNQAALNAGYGQGDACSAYGNRNFYLYFKDWFGSTKTDAYSARPIGQSALNTQEPFYPGEPRRVYIDYLNTGSARWYDSTSVPAGVQPVTLAATEPINRESRFSHGWVSSGRPVASFSHVYQGDGTTLAQNQHIVEPGQVARFEFSITSPWTLAEGNYKENFQPVVEGAANWSMGGVSWLDIKVQSRYKAEFAGQTKSGSTLIRSGGGAVSSIKYKNIGSAAWYDVQSVPTGYFPTKLTAVAPENRNSTLSVDWVTPSVASEQFYRVYEANGITLSQNQHVVMPNQIAEYQFSFRATEQSSLGNIRERLQPIIAGGSHPNMGALSWFDLRVEESLYAASFHAQSPDLVVEKGNQKPLYIEYKNTGNTPWYDDISVPKNVKPIRLAATNPINRSSIFSYTWPSSGRTSFTFSKIYESNGSILASNQHVVLPGQIVRFEFKITPPWTINSGVHREFFQPVVEGASNWYMGGRAWLDLRIP